MSDITVNVTFDGVDMDTGEAISYMDGPGSDEPTEVRIPLEKLLGWEAARRGESE